MSRSVHEAGFQDPGHPSLHGHGHGRPPSSQEACRACAGSPSGQETESEDTVLNNESLTGLFMNSLFLENTFILHWNMNVLPSGLELIRMALGTQLPAAPWCRSYYQGARFSSRCLAVGVFTELGISAGLPGRPWALVAFSRRRLTLLAHTVSQGTHRGEPPPSRNDWGQGVPFAAS